MEEYILPVLRYFFGNHNTNKEELSDLEKSIDSPSYRDKYFDINNNYSSEQYPKYNNNLNHNHENNLNNLNNENNLNNNVQQHPNIRTNLNGEYGSDFVIMI